MKVTPKTVQQHNQYSCGSNVVYSQTWNETHKTLRFLGFTHRGGTFYSKNNKIDEKLSNEEINDYYDNYDE